MPPSRATLGLMHFRDGYAYILSENNALQTYDLSEPMQPKPTASLPVELNVFLLRQRVSSSRRAICGCTTAPHLWAFDLTDAANPRLVGQFDTHSQFTLFAGDNIVAFVIHGVNAAVRVMQLQNENLVEVGSCDIAFEQEQSYVNAAMTVEANVVSLHYYSYAGRGWRYYVQTVDLSDPTQPARDRHHANQRAHSRSDLISRAGAIQHQFGSVITSCVCSTLSDPQNPRETSKITHRGRAQFRQRRANRRRLLLRVEPKWAAKHAAFGGFIQAEKAAFGGRTRR